MDKKEQEKLLTEIMEADAKDGLYEPVTNNHTLTAVEWLVKELKSKGHALVTSEGIFINVPNELLEQAKEMEKEQLSKAMMHALDEDGHTGDWKVKFINDYIDRL